jgi:uncharacterized protein
MDVNQINQPLNQFVTKASKSIKVEEVIVFGSYLEGNATQDSDIDVVVVSDDFESLDDDQRLDLLYESADDIEPIVHAWAFTKEELSKASKLTVWGYARDKGIRFLAGQS